MKNTLIIFLCLTLVINVSASQEKVTVEVAGFITHSPMKPTVDAIKEVTTRYNEVEVVWYDETTPDGEAFLQMRGLAGHIPLVVFIDGELTYDVNGTPITFRDFEGYGWKKGDLEYVLHAKVNNNISAIPNNNQENQNPPYILAGGLILFSLILLLIIIRKRNS